MTMEEHLDSGHAAGRRAPERDGAAVQRSARPDEPNEAVRSAADARYRWVAVGVALIGSFGVVLGTTVVNIGLPALEREFGAGVGVEWVVTAYLAAVGISQMCTGWTAERFGWKRAFIVSLAVFTAGSLLCALATSMPMLIAARVITGIGGGLLMPVAMATVYELFEPEERGRAFGYYGIAIMVAPAVGPVIGGGLVTSIGWRWLFVMNVPLGVIGIPLAMKVLRDGGERSASRFDSLGFALGGGGITSLVVGFARGGSAGWSDPITIGLVVVALAMLVAFVRHELRVAQPLLDVRILANPVFAIGMAVLSLMTVAQYSRLVYIPLQLGSLREVPAIQIGLVMLPSAVGMAVMLPVGGRLTDRIGGRLPVSIGMSVLAASFVGLALLTPTTPLWVVAAVLFAGGAGAGVAVQAPSILALNSVSHTQVSQATGLNSLIRQIVAAIGTALVAAIFAGMRPEPVAGEVSSGSMTPYRVVFLLGAGLLAVSVVVAQKLPGRARAHQLQHERRMELAAARARIGDGEYATA